ncbi:putative MFS sugar transporter [Aspergillus homomorphus CBS 101889]|uniref:Putative MFS sugar transporter n=1 Tax=Aspergillus homomorphus (strain CBS 101889) TaxID=1450537 RepID=A0A395HMB7_ASPHC|nr:putative MFS sugar transporter [Aspergillus homomorphus CBS 101889]RAL08766.1 putative MFS sugar transporter [Aspergillus homomorphus CBS 101889]
MTMQTYSFRNIPNNTHQNWYKDPSLKVNIAHCLGLCLVIFYLGYDAGLLNGLQAVYAWSVFLNHPQGAILGLYAATLYLPSMVTAYIGDFLSQRYGRRVALALGSSIVCIGGLVNAFAVNPAMWVVGRVVIGAGGGVAKVAAPALIQEIAHPRLRPMLAACYYPFFYFGTLLSALLCFAALYIPGNWSWRMPSIVQVFGPLLVLGTLLSCPESPRWLVSKGRNSEALAVLGKYHANGLVSDALVQQELAEIEAALESEDSRHHKTYLDFFQSSGNRRRLYVLLSLSIGQNWVGNGVISYYLTPVLRSVGIESSVQITLLTSGLAIWNLILAFSAALNVERFGRRTLFFVSTAGMLVSYILVMGLSAGFATTQNFSIGIAVVPCLFLYYGFYDLAWTPLPVPYTAEILPFGLRTKGLAIFTSVGTMANSFNQFVNPIALQALAWKYYAVYVVILVFYLVFAYFMYPETKNHTFEEVSAIFDCRDAKDDGELHESVATAGGGSVPLKGVEGPSFVGSSSHRENV